MDNTREPAGHLSAIIAIGLLLIGLVVFGVAQQKAWSHQAELTKNFEACMESAPFKLSLYTSPSPRDRQKSRMPSSA